ncbi:MAG: TerB family tellurite resistance protein [Candidatus Cloacimonetes bacterium]|nr:TerB family tellurite resistance protein [Candidatus Cloacimonadota bacterium]
MSEKIGSYFVNERFSFIIQNDKRGSKVGKLTDLNTGEVLADNMYQKVLPEHVENLMQAVRIIINAAWQDGKISPEEKKAFNLAFKDVNFSDKQQQVIKAEFRNPTPIAKLLKNIRTREEKLLILETSLLLIIADNEFHPKEKEFIELLVKKFDLDCEDFALLYNILPSMVKKYILKERIHETLAINEQEIKILDKFSNKAKKEDKINHSIVYQQFLNNWKNRSTRYLRKSIY